MDISPSVIAELRAIAGADNVVTSPEGRLVYECDAYTLAKGTADVVVMLDRHEQVAPVVRVLARARIPFIPRGSGTGLSGGACPAYGGAVISLARLKRVLALKPREGYAIVEPGVVNAQQHGSFKASFPGSPPYQRGEARMVPPGVASIEVDLVERSGKKYRAVRPFGSVQCSLNDGL